MKIVFPFFLPSDVARFLEVFIVECSNIVQATTKIILVVRV